MPAFEEGGGAMPLAVLDRRVDKWIDVSAARFQ